MKTSLESENLVDIPAGDLELQGNLQVPRGANGVVLFAHGSGSSRHSVRNRFVASSLNEAGLATLLMDLLSEDEEAIDLRTTRLRFDIAFLAERLLHAIDWLGRNPGTGQLDIGLFGSSTGAAAALLSAAERPDEVRAIVSRGGRADLAGPALGAVRAPTLLIVGGNDAPVIELNRQAESELRCVKEMTIVPRASHLFEEPGALEAVSNFAARWFQKHLQSHG